MQTLQLQLSLTDSPKLERHPLTYISMLVPSVLMAFKPESGFVSKQEKVEAFLGIYNPVNNFLN